MSDEKDPTRQLLNLAFRQLEAKNLAIKRAAEIFTNSEPTDWDALAEEEIQIVPADMKNVFEKQIKDSIAVFRQVRDSIS